MSRPRLVIMAVALSATAACSDSVTDPQPAEEAQPTEPDLRFRADSRIRCDADNGGLTLPPGFCAVVVARDLGRARHIAVRPNGDLYVALDDAPDGSELGAVVALRDTDGDGRADRIERFGPGGGNGIAWGHGKLFFARNAEILRYDFSGDELVPTGAPAVVVSGLPTGDGDHPKKTVVLDRWGGMFVNIGSATNSCQVVNRTLESPGVDPCPELAVRAGVWKFRADAVGQTQSSGVRFATELRNMNALAINPFDHRLYGVQNGRDQLFENWPGLFDAEDDALVPAEEVFRIEQGGRYGWPYCYYDAIAHRKVLAPEYGGDGKRVGRCATRERPLATYPAHWAPLSTMFYASFQFPIRYLGGMFTAFHGSRFDPSQQPAGPGYQVTFQRWFLGRPIGKFQTFADGFAGGDPTPTGAAHRPVGLAQGRDGSLFISDDVGGWIWRVIYRGNRR